MHNCPLSYSFWFALLCLFGMILQKSIPFIWSQIPYNLCQISDTLIHVFYPPFLEDGLHHCESNWLWFPILTWGSVVISLSFVILAWIWLISFSLFFHRKWQLLFYWRHELVIAWSKKWKTVCMHCISECKRPSWNDLSKNRWFSQGTDFYQI